MSFFERYKAALQQAATERAAEIKELIKIWENVVLEAARQGKRQVRIQLGDRKPEIINEAIKRFEDQGWQVKRGSERNDQYVELFGPVKE